MANLKKAHALGERDMTIIRCHDAIDIAAGIGMAVSLGRRLSFDETDIIAGDVMYKVYSVKPTAACRWASSTTASPRKRGCARFTSG